MKLRRTIRSTSIPLFMEHLVLYKSAIQSIFILSPVRNPSSLLRVTLRLIAFAVNFFAGMNVLGLPTQFDPNDGTSAGPAFVPTDLDPDNQTRSDARRTYFDPYVSRDNLHVITGQHVTRVLIAGVSGNGEVDTPTPGGNDNGNGPASGNNDGFGFGPGGSTPPLSGQTPPRFARRQDPGTSDLRITGVEVGDCSSLCLSRLTLSSSRPMLPLHVKQSTLLGKS